MTQTVTGVVKGSRVRMAEPARIVTPTPAETSPGPFAPRARIVEQSAGRAVVEIVCECGKVIHLQCLCGDAAAGGEAKS